MFSMNHRVGCALGFAGLAVSAAVSGAAADRATPAPAPTSTPTSIPTPRVAAFFPHAERLLVRMDVGVSDGDAEAALRDAGVVETVYRYTLVPGLRCVRVPEDAGFAGAVDAALAKLAADPRVEYAHRDSVGSILAQVQGYGVDLVLAPGVWPTGTGGGVRVAVLDTGFSTGHPDLPAPIAMQSFVLSEGTSAEDVNGHGTHCAGIVLARDNTIGVVGAAPSADLLVGKVCNNAGSFCATSDALAGIDWAVTNGAKVITMSFSVDDTPTQAFEDTCAAATAAGTLLVAAAGNSADSTVFFPAGYQTVMAVAAVDSEAIRASFSTFGPHVSVSAPGVGVPSTYLQTVTGQIAGATFGGQGQGATPLTNSVSGTVSAEIINCGTGNTAGEFPAGVAGKIAHCRRGGATFVTKANNAVAAGAIGVIISNNAPGLFQGTLGGSPPAIPCIGVAQSDGDFLAANSGTSGSITVESLAGYQTLSGTSMASPHVAGVAATVLSCFAPGTVTPAQLRAALETTATDLGDVGRDDFYGHGLINAVAAKGYLDGILTPPCAADFNGDGGLDPDDLGDYINCYFGVPPCAEADFNGDGGTDPDDLGDYINAFFAGC